MTVPNLLTFVRILLTPLLAWFLLRRSMTAAFGVFFIAGLTDALDGLLARVLNQKSRLGAYVDPLADKLLLLTSFVLLWKVGEIPSWLIWVVLTRDFVILSGLLVLFFCQVHFEIRPLTSSKLTTLFQLGTVFSLLGKSILKFPEVFYSVLFVITAGLSIWSGGRYVSNGLAMLKRHRAGNTA